MVTASSRVGLRKSHPILRLERDRDVEKYKKLSILDLVNFQKASACTPETIGNTPLVELGLIHILKVSKKLA